MNVAGKDKISLQANWEALMYFKDPGIAIFYSNIRHWCANNAANEINFHEGRYWTYNSARAFSEQFPFWSEKQISLMLKKLEDAGFIMSGSFNKMKADRTKWYSDLKD